MYAYALMCLHTHACKTYCGSSPFISIAIAIQLNSETYCGSSPFISIAIAIFQVIFTTRGLRKHHQRPIAQAKKKKRGLRKHYCVGKKKKRPFSRFNRFYSCFFPMVKQKQPFHSFIRISPKLHKNELFCVKKYDTFDGSYKKKS